MRRRNRLDRDHLFRDVFEPGDYGMCPPPCRAQKAPDELQRYFLGEGWYTTNPVSRDQVNAEIVYAIESRYRGAVED